MSSLLDNEAPGGAPAPPASAADPLLIEDSKYVTTSVLGGWREAQDRLKAVRRPWPFFEPNAPRGGLKKRQPVKDPTEPPAAKKKRTPDAEPPVDITLAPVDLPDENATLPLPEIPGVPIETVNDLLARGTYSRCELCPGCLANKDVTRKSAPCATKAALRAWDAALGGVSAAVARDIAAKAVTANMRRGPRCGGCRTCRLPWQKRPACVTATAVVKGQLPERLKAAVGAEGAAAEAGHGAVEEDAWQVLRDIERGTDVERVGENAELMRNLLRFGDGGGGSSDGGRSDVDSEEDQRWAHWVDAMRYCPYGAISAPEEGPSGAWLTAPAKRKQQKKKKESAGDGGGPGWMCRAGVRDGEGGMLEECGHGNSEIHQNCSVCGAPRWEGPSGELRARIAAALQTGALVGASERGMDDLVASIAARIAAEAGSFPAALPGFLAFDPAKNGVPASENVSEEEESEDTLLELVAEEVDATLKAMQVGGGGEGGGGSSRTTSGSGKQQQPVEAAPQVPSELAHAAKRTLLGRATAGLESSIRRLVEERAALDSTPTVSAASPGGHSHPSSSTRPTPAPLQRGAAAAAAADRCLNLVEGAVESMTLPAASPANPAVGFTALCEEVSGVEGLGLGDSSQRQTVCESLFAAAPSSEGWTHSSLRLLAGVLRDAEACVALHAAASCGGPGLLRRALHAALCRQQQWQQPDEAGGGGSSQGLGGSPFFPPTQQSQPLPGSTPPPPPLSAACPSPSAAAPPADAALERANELFIEEISCWGDEPEGGLPSGTWCVVGEGSAAAAEAVEARRVLAMSDVAGATFHFAYGMVHSVLDAVAKSGVEKRLPKAALAVKREVLERARFPPFPPPPPVLSPLADECEGVEGPRAGGFPLPPGSGKSYLRPFLSHDSDRHVISRPIPDSARPTHAMLPELTHKKKPRRFKGRKKEEQESVAARAPKARPGAFAVWSSGRDGEESETVVDVEAAWKLEVNRLLQRCPAEVQLVLGTAAAAGVRSEVVAAAARKFLTTISSESHEEESSDDS